MQGRSSKIAFEIILGLVVAGVLFWAGYVLSLSIGLDDIEEVTRLVKTYGAIVAIPIIVAEVVVAPIPGGIITIVLGAVYGSTLGALYAWIGNVLGSIIAFWIARFLGERVVHKLLPKVHFEMFNKFIEKNSVLLWLVYIVPIFPIDLLSFAIGFSKKKFKSFGMLITLAFIPHVLLLSFLGDLFTGAGILVKVGIGVGILSIFAVAMYIERNIVKNQKPQL